MSGSGTVLTSRRPMPSLPVRPSAPVPHPRLTRKRTRTARTNLVQNAAFALGEAAIDRCGVSLCKLRLEVLVDQQQRAHGTAQVAVAACHDLVDRSIFGPQAHRNSPVQIRINPAGLSRIPEGCEYDRRPPASKWRNRPWRL